MRKVINYIKKNKKSVCILIILILSIFGIFILKEKNEKDNKINYPTFLKMVENKEIKKVTIKGFQMKLKLKNGDIKFATYPNTPTFKEEILKNEIEVDHIGTNGYEQTIIYVLAVSATLFFMYKYFSPKNMIKSMELDNNELTQRTKFDNVAGIDEAKDQLFEVVEHLKNPKICSEVGVRAPKGVLLVGPPGTGKTLLAKAVAGEANVPFFSVTGSDFVQMFAGLGALRVRDLFKNAREKEPCVIFIDEIDAIGKQRGNSNSSNDEKDQTLNSLLTEMDGFKDNSGIVVIAATNRIDILDKALLRAGRFDRHVEVSYSDTKGREEILKVHSNNKKFDDEVNLSNLAKKTTGFSGADLENLLNESGWEAIRNNRKVITTEDIDNAFNSVVAGPKKKRNILSEKEKRIVAYHESGHAIITRFLANIKIEKINITPTSKSLGYVLKNEDDKCLKTKNDFKNDICILLGGRIAEELIFGEDNITNGASEDLKQATEIAYKMVTLYGMSEEIGRISINIENENTPLKISEDIKNKTYKGIKSILNELYETTKLFLIDNSGQLEKLANYLLINECITESELDNLFKKNN